MGRKKKAAAAVGGAVKLSRVLVNLANRLADQGISQAGGLKEPERSAILRYVARRLERAASVGTRVPESEAEAGGDGDATGS